MNTKLDVIKGSGNVFRDLGMANADTEHMKSHLAAGILAILRRKRLTAVKAAQLAHVAEADISRIRNADLNRFTIDRLVRILNALGEHASITIGQYPNPSCKPPAA